MKYKKTPRAHIPKKIRDQVKAKFDGHCAYCGEKPSRIFIDHLEPHQYTQDDSIDNLMPSCQACNLYKSVLFLETFRKELEDSVRKARQYSVNYRFAELYDLVESNEKKIVFYFEKANALHRQNSTGADNE